MRAAIVICLLTCAFAQETGAPFRDLEADRIEDTYALYGQVLRAPIWDHKDDGGKLFIANHTGQTYNIDSSRNCIKAPGAFEQRLNQALDDFARNKQNSYKIENRLPLERPYQLITKAQEEQLGMKFFRGEKPADRSLGLATDIVRVSAVGFSADRSLAILVVSNYCGGLCGGEKWHILKRTEKGWVEQKWSSCIVIS